MVLNPVFKEIKCKEMSDVKIKGGGNLKYVFLVVSCDKYSTDILLKQTHVMFC